MPAGTFWYNDFTNNTSYGWLNGSSTPTGSTGPSTAFDGTYFMYVEGSSNYGANYKLNSKCIDLSSYTDPSLVFSYHMYGTNMGSLDVEVSSDSGATWNSVWQTAGDKGNIWYETVVSLSV